LSGGAAAFPELIRMTVGPFTAAAASYALMLGAYFAPRRRLFHIPVMIAVICFDLAMPVYLYTHRDWYQRLIVHEQLFTFLVWMHFGLLIALYGLEAAQVHAGTRILRGDEAVRQNHHNQGKALLVVRGLVILTGAFLANP
jgi:hypothetical protein